MAKTTLTDHHYGTIEPDVHFLVETKEDAKAISDLGFSAHVYSLEGAPLTGWTPAKGLAEKELNELGSSLHKKTIVLLMARYIHASDKVQKLCTALKEFAPNINATFTAPQTEPGASIKGTIEHFGTELMPTIMGIGHLMITDQAEQAETFEDTGDDDDEKATILFNMVQSSFTLARTRDNSLLFLLPNPTAKLTSRAYEIGSTELRHWMTRTYYERTKKVVPSKDVRDVVETLAGLASASPHILTISNRTFQDLNGKIWIDLGTENGNVAVIEDGSWTIESSLPYSSGHAFLRNEATLPINNPQEVKLKDARATLETHLLPYINAQNEDWPLVVAWMINHLIPNHYSPILMLLATQGSGKSTATKAVKFAVEGGLELGEVGGFKDNEDDVMVAMSKARVTMYDNVSKISEDLSDTLCKVVYGTTHEKRKLRTDSDVVTLKVNSSLILNGIETGQLRGDLKSRMVTVNLNSGVLKQMTGANLKTDIVKAHPAIYGALLTLIANVLPLLVQAPEWPSDGPKGMRMQDYARVLWALDQLWNTNGIARYISSLNQATEELLDDPLLLTATALVRRYGTYISEDGAYEGIIGAKELLNAYNGMGVGSRLQLGAAERETINPQKLGGMLTRAQGEWTRLGVTIRKEDRITLRGVQQVTYWIRVSNPELQTQSASVNVDNF